MKKLVHLDVSIVVDSEELEDGIEESTPEQLEEYFREEMKTYDVKSFLVEIEDYVEQ